MWRAFRNFGLPNVKPDVQMIVDHPLLISDATADGSPWDMNDAPPGELSAQVPGVPTAEQNRLE